MAVQGFGALPVHDWHFNEDMMLDVAAYADPDRNPYVVGSAAYNYVHGLPPPLSWEERTSEAADDARQRELLAAANVPSGSNAAIVPTGAGETNQPATSSGLPWGVLVVIAAILAFK
jgi:hypothetical protein